MNLQYGVFFKYPRKVFKYFLSFIYPIVIRINPLPEVKSIPETIDEISEKNRSICRFGDGELLYIAEKRSLPFQKQHDRLRNYLIEILKSDDPNILVGLPIGYQSLENLKPEAKLTWRAIISWTYPKVKKFLKKEKVYHNASITRLYMDFKDTTQCSELFQKIMTIWENRDVLLIEGEKSRLGVGNDLFKNAKGVSRVIGPAHNAFDKFDELLNFAKAQSKEKLVLVAMGPTAKPVVYELAQAGFQAIDIGNLDIEYEWYLQGATQKVKIEGKYTSEVKGGRSVADMNNKEYDNQKIAEFL